LKGLQVKPRVIARHSLRLRLTLGYTLLTLALTGLLGGLAYYALIGGLEREIRSELSEYAKAFQDRLDDPLTAIQEAPMVWGGMYYQLLDDAGEPIPNAASKNLGGLNLPLQNGLQTQASRSLWIKRSPWRLGGVPVGTLLVALNADEFVRTRSLAAWVLFGMVLLTTALAFPLGYIIGGRALRRLEFAADRAANVNPANPHPLGVTGPRNDEVGVLVQALEGTLERIRDRQTQERGLLAEIAHELGTPLTVLTAQLEALTREIPDSRLGSARDSAWDLARTAEDLLFLARGEIEPTLDLHLVDMRDLVIGVLAEHPDAPIDYIPPPTQLEVLGDPTRLRQALRNLIRNAVRAVASKTRSGSGAYGLGCVRIGFKVQDRTLVLEVTDDGPGIPPEALPLIFERYYSKSGGSGVGLAVVRSIARAHRGEASASNVPEGGAKFTIRLPLAEEQFDDEPLQNTTPTTRNRLVLE
jgi:two-component system, OmpR family, sensor kinase